MGTTSVNDENLKPEIPYEPGITTEGLSEDLSESYTLGNTQSNIQNLGHLAFDGEWYYFTGNDGGRMCRMKADGSEKSTLTDVESVGINLYGGYVYFFAPYEWAIMRMKPDGSELKVLYPDGHGEFRIMGDRIVYGVGGMSSIDLEGGDFRELNTLDGYYFTFDGRYIYYQETNSEFIMRSEMDGSGTVCILDHPCAMLSIAGNRLFFQDAETNRLSSYNLSTGELMELSDRWLICMNVTPEGIYGSELEGPLVFIPHDGGEEKVLAEGACDGICVAGDKIFYRSQDSEVFHIMDRDGSNIIEA